MEAGKQAVQHTAGPWLVATSNSWRRIVSQAGHSVCEPINQNDGHQDLYFRNGGAEGPDARLIAAAPELLAELQWAYDRSYNPFEPDNQSADYKRIGALLAKVKGAAA